MNHQELYREYSAAGDTKAMTAADRSAALSAWRSARKIHRLQLLSSEFENVPNFLKD